ncbi:hypothetical protein SMD22_01425 (plasmid) [Brevibacillus halotolerans]|nr:hypothetical protein SMD22_01425 [Brevibacillus halotolerans]
MSVNKYEDGTTIIELGQGTTAINMVYPKYGKHAIGISFATLDKNLQPIGDKTIIQICNTSGVISYVQALIDLLATWEIAGNDYEEIEEAKKQMDNLHKTLCSMR